MRNLIKIFVRVQELRPFALAVTCFGPGIASVKDKWHLVISLARSCQCIYKIYQNIQYGCRPTTTVYIKFIKISNMVVDLRRFPYFINVCVEVLRPSQPNGVMSSAVSLPNHTFTGQA